MSVRRTGSTSPISEPTYSVSKFAYRSISQREPQSVREARAWVEAVCREWVPAPRSDVLLLVASELVTNSIVHGMGTIDVEMTFSERCVHIEVTDRGDSLVHPLAPGPNTVHGRGLQIVAGLSDRWGTFHKHGKGNTVWAQVLV